MLGFGAEYKSQFGNILPVPNWLYEHMERWHYLSFLKTRKTLELLRQIRFQALEPQKIDALIALVDHDLGYRLYQAVEQKSATSQKARSANSDLTNDAIQIADKCGTRPI